SATCSCIRDAEKVGLKHLTHFCNQMTPLHHREIGMVGAGLMDDDLLIELIGDKIHLSEDMLRLVYQLKNKDKIAVITDSLAATGLDDGDYEIGGLPIYVRDGAARLKHNDHLAGSTLRMNVALKNIAEVTRLPLEKLIQTTSYNQAQSLGLTNLGKIEANYIADLVVLDKYYDVQMVMVDGVVK
ncbi:MAG: amidohydrolase family protein, partial [Bacteroidales bacterium]|nr:amidohydrolase family protein [Bacteroidales bacterium]